MSKEQTILKISKNQFEDLTRLKDQFKCKTLGDVITLLIDNFYSEENYVNRENSSQNVQKRQFYTFKKEDEDETDKNKPKGCNSP
jgi:hypothetical protein